MEQKYCNNGFTRKDEHPETTKAEPLDPSYRWTTDKETTAA